MHHSSTDASRKQANTAGVVLLAAAAGAVAGLLFAPKRGVETREEIKGKYNDMMNKGQDTIETAKDKVSQGVDTARSKVHIATDKTKEAVDKAADKTHEATDKAADKTKQATSTKSPSVELTPEQIVERAARSRNTPPRS